MSGKVAKKAPSAKQRSGCCKAWDDLAAAQRAEWAWQVLHEMAHSRVPFSVRRLADLARLDLQTATQLAASGRIRKWITYTDTPGLLVGALSKKR